MLITNIVYPAYFPVMLTANFYVLIGTEERRVDFLLPMRVTFTLEIKILHQGEEFSLVEPELLLSLIKLDFTEDNYHAIPTGCCKDCQDHPFVPSMCHHPVTSSPSASMKL